MNINSLPEDCLRQILSRCKLQELVHLRVVCHHWRTLIELMFFEHKHTLKIFGSCFDVQHFAEMIAHHRMNEHIDLSITSKGSTVDDVLIISPTGGPAACHHLPLLFPNITKLLVCSKQLFEAESFPALLQSYPSLHTLSLNARMLTIPGSLLTSINSLSSLKRLYLSELFQSRIPPNLSVLSQLEHFTIAQYIHDCVDVLRQLGPNCRELVFCWVNLNVEQMDRLLSLNPALERNVTHLVFGFVATNHNNRLKHSYNLFQLICDRFKALESIDIMFTDHLPITLLAPQLFKLSHLRELFLYLSPHELPEDRDRLYTLPQLTSITDLKLEIYNLTMDTFRHWIPGLFPNLQYIMIKCDYEAADREIFQEQCLTTEVFPRLLDCRFSM